MFLEIFKRIQDFRKPVRSLMLFSFVYALGGSLIGSFLQITLFQKFSDLSLNIIFAMASFTGVMIAFTLGGYILGKFNLSSKYGFYYCILLVAISLPSIAFAPTPTIASFAMFIEGVGIGLYYLTVHTYELTETKDEERDFYSSALSSGNKIIGLIGPFLATGLYIIAENLLHVPGYTLLFIVAPCIFLLGIFCFEGISDYKPRKIFLADVTYFFSEKKNLLAQLYIGGNGMKDMIGTVIPPLVIFTILGSEVKVGIYNTILALIGTLTVILVGHRRNVGNRMMIFGVSTLIVSMALIYLGYSFDLTGLLIFSVLNALVGPIMSVSDHVISLKTMESIGRAGQDFYSTMVLRDFSLWFWRLLSGFLLLFIFSGSVSGKDALSLGLYLLAFLLLIAFIGAKLFLRFYKKTS